MSDAVVHLTFPARPEYLLLARLALSGLARELPVDDETLADLKLAVTEACGNAVRHAYPEGADGAVAIAYRVAGERLEMVVEDEGEGIHVGQANGGAEPFESGMGMAIIRAIVDELSVDEGEGGRGTVVRMTKYLPRA